MVFTQPYIKGYIMKQIGKIAVFGELGGLIPYNAFEQMQECMESPVALRAALMPDAHLGYGLPIGGVIEMADSISPGYIGYDISCMVKLSVFDIDPDEFKENRANYAQALRDSTSFGIGKGFEKKKDHPVMEDERWNVADVVKGLRVKAHNQLGSSGGGNHFADIVSVRYLDDIDLQETIRIGLLTHSGSRGTGHNLATYYIKLAERETAAVKYTPPIRKGHGWLGMDTDAGREYWHVMGLMGEYAQANHDLIHESFQNIIGTFTRFSFSNRHNYAWYDGNGIYTHRKGATPADVGEVGIIPGTSSSPSWLVRGLGNYDSIESSSHGAGRPFSRSQAKKEYDDDAYTRQRGSILHLGVNKDEVQGAYKDIEEVLQVQDGILLERVARLDPHVVLMGGKADDGD